MSRVKRPETKTAAKKDKDPYKGFVAEHLLGFALARLQMTQRWIDDAIRATNDGMPCLAEKLLEECSTNLRAACEIIEHAKSVFSDGEKNQ